MNPGATIMPLASNTSASLIAENLPGSPTSLTTSPSRRTSLGASVFDPGSTTRPFLISNILEILILRNGVLRDAVRRTTIMCRSRLCCGMRAAFNFARHEHVQNRHAYAHSVRHLFEHAGL